MGFENPSRDQIKELLQQTKTIAVVGLSDKPDRTSYMVSQAMQSKGYRIIPVNPNVDSVLGEKSYASLADIDEQVDIVNVFRRSEDTVPVAQETLRMKHKPKAFWLQQGIFNDQAASLVQAEGIQAIMDRCIKVEDSILLPK
ncbi:CoA-binding protein [Paenibacillus hemerocallicola]|uniref:CoA-binding protein n=1 Tax=Paenibacillus hemerocallicola TaxID=1172614 RepID=A0A5C4TFF5_9BACL|nr:CoA-binding protein [Paenibacillus hemerocallicola]TNJ67149.1 CoA-binding protein [Paenibacillus hemerocallicola]